MSEHSYTGKKIGDLSESEFAEFKEDLHKRIIKEYGEDALKALSFFAQIITSPETRKIVQAMGEELESDPETAYKTMGEVDMGAFIKRALQRVDPDPQSEPDLEKTEQIIKKLLERKTFSPILQGTATNALTKVRPVIGNNTTVDEMTGTATVKEGGLILNIDDFEELDGLKTSTYKLLDALTVAFTESSDKENPEIQISLDDYMKVCGLSDKKTARKQVNADLETLFKLRISFKGKNKNDTMGDFLDARLCQYKGIKKGVIYFSLTTPFHNYLKSYAKIMPFPQALWRLNSRRNPNSYELGRKITEQKNMNSGKKTEDIISVKTLLKAAPYIPSYEAVATSDRLFTRRIIDPFERDMNALAAENIKICTWEYCKKNGEPLTEEELNNFDYGIFSKLNVKIKWYNYPDQTRRLEQQKQKRKEAKEIKKQSTKKKK